MTLSLAILFRLPGVRLQIFLTYNHSIIFDVGASLPQVDFAVSRNTSTRSLGYQKPTLLMLLEELLPFVRFCRWH